MSLTLPYSTAVNCKFVTLPDQLASTDNTLKLYNIDGSVPGGDSYTKAESDARYLKLVSASQQNVSNTVNFQVEPLFQSPFMQKPNFKRGITVGGYNVDLPGITISSVLENSAAADLFIPQLQYTTAQILVNVPSAPQTVERLNFSTGVFLKSSGNLNYVQLRSASQNDNNKFVQIPTLLAGCDLVVTKPNATTQTIQGNLRVSNLQTGGWWNPYNGGTTNILVGIEQDDLTSDKIITIPKISQTTQFIVANPSATQTVAGRLNVGSLGLNGNQITDLVTTVTGASDTKVPSEKAVKTYVDTASTAAIPKTDIVTTITGTSNTKVPSEKSVFDWVTMMHQDFDGTISLTQGDYVANKTLNASLQGRTVTMQIEGTMNPTIGSTMIMGTIPASINNYYPTVLRRCVYPISDNISIGRLAYVYIFPDGTIQIIPMTAFEANRLYTITGSFTYLK